jgi:prepilin-type N-terminal cleavage/methylation domain-containing protein
MPRLIAGSDRRTKLAAQAGVTLLELILVIVILGLLAALVGPPIGHWIDDWELRGSAERVAQAIRYARVRALYEHRYYLVELRPANRDVRVAEPASGFVRDYSLPSAVRWSDDKQNLSTAPLRFLLPPSGPVELKTIWLRGSTGTWMKIHIAFLPGNTQVEISRERS